MSPKYLTIREVAQYTSTSFRTLEGWKRNGYLPPHFEMTSRIHRWRRSDIDAWMELMQRGLWDDWLELRGELGPIDAWEKMLQRLNDAA